MIGLRTVNDTNDGNLRLFDNSSISDTITKGLINIGSIGLRAELDSSSYPTLSAFLSPNSNNYVEFKTPLDSVLEIDYALLSPLTDVTFTVGNNLVNKWGIYNLFLNTDYIYIDQIYTINKKKSTNNTLYLTQPIVESKDVFKAYYIRKCVTTLFKIPCTLKSLSFDDADCCDCNQGNILGQAYRFIEALKVQQDCNDCNKQRLILDKLKTILNVC